MSKRHVIFLILASSLFAFGFTGARANWHRHSVTTSGGGKNPVTSCSDLRIRFDDKDAVVRSEERTLTRAEASVLKIQPHRNGGAQVVGWDKDTYSVTICKAAAGSADEAERILPQIRMNIRNGEVSTEGPAGDEDWTAYLLIRAPKNASLDVTTMNGPLSFYDVDGKLAAHANNGPISVKNFSGDAEIFAMNGPISLEGNSGNLRVHTQNGPISVALNGPAWNGAGLSADAQNGPLTLLVPAGYKSSFVVESTNHAPVSCEAAVCNDARRTWDDEHRRIEYGSAPAVIRLSTVNGPVSVEQLRETL